MLKQTFVVTLEIPFPFDWCFPTVEAGQMANIIRDGVETKGVSFMGQIPFTIYVERENETVSASGLVREYSIEEFPDEEGVQKQTRAKEILQVR